MSPDFPSPDHQYREEKQSEEKLEAKVIEVEEKLPNQQNKQRQKKKTLDRQQNG